MLLVAEFDRRRGYERWERRTTAEWLEWKCGLRSGTGHDHVRVARALPDLPKVRGAFATGALSYSKVRALVRVATPATEADLVEMARLLTGNQLERPISAYARAVRELTGEDLERMEAKRSVQRRRDRDGDGWVWTLHLPTTRTHCSSGPSTSSATTRTRQRGPTRAPAVPVVSGSSG